MSNSQSKHDIIQVCDRIKNLLLSKNEKYGDAALNPTRIMSKANAVEQILIRIDDKLNRINKGAGLLASDEDVVQDLAGYFILLIIALERQNQSNFETVKQIIDGATASGQPYKGLDAAWDKKDDSPSYVGRGLCSEIPMPARLLSTDECREMGLPVTPQVNWTDEPEPELDEEPAPIPRTEQEKENEKTLRAWEKLLTHQLGQLGISFSHPPFQDDVPSEPPSDPDEDKLEDDWKDFLKQHWTYGIGRSISKPEDPWECPRP